MTPEVILTVIIVYFGILLTISFWTARNADSNAFFIANKQSPWYLVAFGMIGTSISGVTFISVPGMVGKEVGGEANGFFYFQLILGQVIGYIVIATVLMPLYYRLNLISIYTYLEQRFGFWSYKTGAAFFLLSRSIGSSLRLFLAAIVLQLFLFDQWNVPFAVTVGFTILLIWIYTFKGGVKTIIWTDSFQTIFLVSSVIISIYLISQELGWSMGEMIRQVDNSRYSQIFFFDDFKDNKHFIKQFISGIFIAIVMTGLDQDLMQKNLTCKNIKEAQKNMFSFTGIMVAINIFFLTLGALLYIYCNQKGIKLPDNSDHLYPTLALEHFGWFAGLCFLLGIIASSYASADSALAALTTSFCIDFLNFKNKDEKTKQQQKFWTHIGFSLLFLVIIIIAKETMQASVIQTVLKTATYTYGPLLGLFSFGIFTKRIVNDRWYTVPLICIASPLITLLLNLYSKELFWGYEFSFETLIVNGLICFLGLWIFSRPGNGSAEVIQKAS
ncbi:MAG: sodium:solute symporter [Cytophagaceae bacterium]|nr:sodium:solute symporter [Cytophagaceae bacterium]